MEPTVPRLILTTFILLITSACNSLAPEAEARPRGAGAAHNTVVDIMRCFSSPQFVEALRSTCLKIMGVAADATGPQLHKARQHAGVSTLPICWVLKSSACFSRGQSFCRILSMFVPVVSPRRTFDH